MCERVSTLRVLGFFFFKMRPSKTRFRRVNVYAARGLRTGGGAPAQIARRVDHGFYGIGTWTRSVCVRTGGSFRCVLYFVVTCWRCHGRNTTSAVLFIPKSIADQSRPGPYTPTDWPTERRPSRGVGRTTAIISCTRFTGSIRRTRRNHTRLTYVFIRIR